MDEQVSVEHWPISEFAIEEEFDCCITFQVLLLHRRQVPLLHSTVLMIAMKERYWWISHQGLEKILILLPNLENKNKQKLYL